MKIIFSPAKKMKVDTESMPFCSLPMFSERAEEIFTWLKERNYEELKRIWECSDAIGEKAYKILKETDLNKNLTPAVLSYEGIAFKYMAPAVFCEDELNYIKENLLILSAFYGILRAMDGVVPYRLEMQAKAKISGYEDLYAFWGRTLYDAVRSEDGIIINLASKEYSKCIEKYLTDKDTFINCVFAEIIKEKPVTKGVYAKMARGEMVRFMAERNIKEPERLREFDRLGFIFSEKYSKENKYVFIKS